ncbi:winged helix-turn-helix transcriptional regulator [Cellulosilyticum sp. I15G10I2]|uniref:winged helix-turn-helix transcriptional regulator n=1 Tax=Cellulosilyticum sp. I15G10I2 TaxID=1892843 RepID=UPI00085C3C3A|nr:helix-turn-helix domain-containing protein [Cellulosilyticum sp. I15G10I2]
MARLNKEDFTIPVEATLDILGGKWKTLILCHLSYGPKRTSELIRLMPKITQKVLTHQLKELIQDDMIIRKSYNEVPPKVTYELSKLGYSIKPILNSMCDWGQMYIDQYLD